MALKSLMQHSFSQIPFTDLPRSEFNRIFGHKTTFNANYLVPFMVDEALPGDTHNLKATIYCRLLSPLTYPIMDNLKMSVFFFKIPARLVWPNWVKMHGEQIDPDDSTDYEVPQVVAPAVTGFTTGSLFDYFGIPTEIPGISINALYSRCYNLTYNQYFRDQNLIDSAVVDLDDGPDDPADYPLRKVAKMHDYFTSGLPWPQKTNDGTDALLPLGSSAPVVSTGASIHVSLANNAWVNKYLYMPSGAPDPINTVTAYNSSTQLSSGGIKLGSPSGMAADLSSATSATINELRESFQIQKMFEKDARGGTRYPEMVKAHFGVNMPVSEWRVEYLGGTSAPVNVQTVAQTSESGTTKQGNLSAFATIRIDNVGFVKSFVEHCYILGLMCVRADQTYQQGIPRPFLRKTRYDHYYPSLAHLGEQVVTMAEIFAKDPATDTNSDGIADNNDVFCYQERWSEYKYKPSMITGQLRSNHATPLHAWHLSEYFTDAPTLDQAFIESNVPMSRVKAVTTAPDFIFDSFIKIRTARPMPMYSVPGLIDHF